MQGSFWKTVALVAVIGVGSLAVLEVRDRLENSPSALESSGASNGKSLANDMTSVVENAVTADLQDSDFDRMMKTDFAPSANDSANAAAGAEGQTAFNMSEPDGGSDQTFAEAPQQMASQFSLADTPSAQPVDTVDTHVAMASLTDEPNPFEIDNETDTAAAGADVGGIQPAGFVADDQSSGESAVPTPFAAFDSAAFGHEESASTTAAATSAATNSAENAAPTAHPAGQMQFFSGGDAEANHTSAHATVQASPAAFGNGLSQEKSDASPFSGGGFEQFEEDDSNVNSSAGSSVPVPGFSPGDNLQNNRDGSRSLEISRQPEFSNPSDTVGDRSPFFQPGADATDDPGNEFVPLPRDEIGHNFDALPDSGSSNRSFDDTPEGTQSLPFADDSELNVPILNSPPDAGGDLGLEIPPTELDRNRGSSGRENLAPSFDSGSDFREFPASNFDNRETFDSERPARATPASPWDSNPTDRSEFDSRRSLESDLNSRDRTFGNERLNGSENGGINPGFDATPRRVPEFDDRTDDLRSPRDGNRPLSIDPGFGSDSRDTGRGSEPSDFERRDLERRDLERRDLERRDQDFRDRSRSNDPYGREIGRPPVREFGGSRDSLDFPTRPQPENNRFNDEPIGSGPLGGRREFGGSSTDRMRDDLRSDNNRLGGNIRQVASVMRPKLVLQKSAPENATVGTPLLYSITIRNDGDAPAYDVVVEDEVTAAGRIDLAKPQASRTNNGERLKWEFDSIAPGTEKEIQVQVTPTGEGVIDGVATVKFKSRVKATTTITAPRLELRMEGPTKVRLGDKVQYLYTIVNEGSGDARSVFVRTVLPQDGGLRHPQGQDLEYEIPVMKPGERREILLSVVAGEPGSQQAQAIVTSRNGSKDEAVWSTDVIGAQLQMLRRGPKRRFVSKTARYENIVTNETDFDAVNARVVEQVPPGMEFKAAGQGGRFDPDNRTVTWAIQRLAAKATTTLQLELEPRVAGKQDSRVMIYENIGAQSDDYVSTTLVEDLHNVSATISQLEGPVALGEGFGFTVTVDNRGTADATDVQLTVHVPREIKVDGAGTEDVHAGLIEETNTVVYRKVVRIRPNQKQNFELKLRGVQPGRNLIVKAEVQSSQMDEPLDVSESVTIYDDRN